MDTNGKNHIFAIRAMDQSTSLGYGMQRNAQCHIYRMLNVNVDIAQRISNIGFPLGTTGFFAPLEWGISWKPSGLIQAMYRRRQWVFRCHDAMIYRFSRWISHWKKIRQFSWANPIFNRIITTPAIISIIVNNTSFYPAVN